MKGTRVNMRKHWFKAMTSNVNFALNSEGPLPPSNTGAQSGPLPLIRVVKRTKMR